jgi:hypothetical protein
MAAYHPTVEQCQALQIEEALAFLGDPLRSAAVEKLQTRAAIHQVELEMSGLTWGRMQWWVWIALKMTDV